MNPGRAAGRCWVAIQVGEARSVQPCERIDALGIDTRSLVPVQEGLHLTVALRFSGGSRTNFEVPVRVLQAEGRIDAGGTSRVRLEFSKNADPAVLREVAALASAVGLYKGEMPAFEPAAAPGRSGAVVRATPQGETVAWVLRFPTADERRAVGLQILNGTLFVETQQPAALNSLLLLRIDDPGSRPLYVEARVQYVSEGRHGPPGMGLAPERVPAIIADALRR